MGLRLRLRFAFVLALLAGGMRSIACDCIELSVKEAVKRSDAVLVGVVQSVTRAEVFRLNTLSGFFRWFVIRTEIKVEREFKGRMVTEVITVYTEEDANDRGSGFLTGQRYVIYGDRDPEFGVRHLSSDKPLYGCGVYWTNDCMRTRLFDGEEVMELEGLRKGRAHR